MRIGIVSDHRGVYLKEKLIEYLEHSGYEVINYGTDSVESVDFPEYAKMNPCVDAEQMLRERLDKLLKEEKQLNSLLKNEQREINERIQIIQPVLKQRDKFSEILDLMKSHCTKTEEEMRKMLCQIQRKITQQAVNA